jgi:hypothetical protein
VVIGASVADRELDISIGTDTLTGAVTRFTI